MTDPNMISSSIAPLIAPSISRRTVLGLAVAATTVIAAGGVVVMGSTNAFAATAAVAASSTEAIAFLRLSEFVTGGRPLEAGLATRYLAALAKRNPKFNERAAEVTRYLADAKAASIDDLLARDDLAEPLKKTITQIVSAWYLGIVGVDADAELIAYADALMYRPTIDVLVVPTYGHGPDSWGNKPANLSTVPNEKKKP